jgi:SAM-dependent methyltransferase
MSNNPWGELAEIYQQSRSAAEKLIEWPAQLRMVGDFRGKRILDIGCGSGQKARYFAEHGAGSVVGIDSSKGFAREWSVSPAGIPNLQLIEADFEDLPRLPELHDKPFDVIVSFQSIMYARNLTGTVKAIAQLLSDSGVFVLSVPHPFRFAVLKNELEGWGHGFAYQHTQPYRYPSPWKADMYLEHAMPRVSDYLNAILQAGLQITSCEEPMPTDELRRVAPEKSDWMDRYVGIIVVRAELSKPRPA